MRNQGKIKPVLVILISLFLIILAFVIWDNFNIQVTSYTISSDQIPENFSGFRIVQISDLHNAVFGHNNKKLLDEIVAADPDIIVITGDIVDSRRTDYQVAISFAQKANNIAPTYYITGNHESRISESGKLEGGLIGAGVTILTDEDTILEQNSQYIRMVGIQDPAFRAGSEKDSTDNILTQLNMNDDMYTVLLSHRPELFEVYEAKGVELVITGHAHGGQFRLPFIGGLFAPHQGFLPKYDAGIFNRNNTNMIVSRGIGNSIFPFRFNNRPEIVVVELQNSN